tara:strand:+ start:356 stop:943 length:588 start_codon:yes stop_codon:yes gene_type:complete
MSNLMKHAKRELELAGMFDEDSDYSGMLGNAIMELIKVFAKQGHSGFSASRTIQIFSKLADYKPLIGITGKDGEWSENTFDGKTYQNKRLSSLFKEGENGKPYYINAIVFREEDGQTFTGSQIEFEGNGYIGSSQYIKGFPFQPKTFYIDVISTEWADKKETEKKKGGGWWTHKLKDPKQLDEVWEYYDRKEEIK